MKAPSPTASPAAMTATTAKTMTAGGIAVGLCERVIVALGTAGDAAPCEIRDITGLLQTAAGQMVDARMGETMEIGRMAVLNAEMETLLCVRAGMPLEELQTSVGSRYGPTEAQRALETVRSWPEAQPMLVAQYGALKWRALAVSTSPAPSSQPSPSQQPVPSGFAQAAPVAAAPVQQWGTVTQQQQHQPTQGGFAQGAPTAAPSGGAPWGTATQQQPVPSGFAQAAPVAAAPAQQWGTATQQQTTQGGFAQGAPTIPPSGGAPWGIATQQQQQQQQTTQGGFAQGAPMAAPSGGAPWGTATQQQPVQGGFAQAPPTTAAPTQQWGTATQQQQHQPSQGGFAQGAPTAAPSGGVPWGTATQQQQQQVPSGFAQAPPTTAVPAQQWGTATQQQQQQQAQGGFAQAAPTPPQQPWAATSHGGYSSPAPVTGGYQQQPMQMQGMRPAWIVDTPTPIPFSTPEQLLNQRVCMQKRTFQPNPGYPPVEDYALVAAQGSVQVPVFMHKDTSDKIKATLGAGAPLPQFVSSVVKAIRADVAKPRCRYQLPPGTTMYFVTLSL